MSQLRPTLNLLDATMLVAGSMIGSGIFIVSTYMARDLGSAGWLIVAWLISGLITMMAALSYGELAGMMPKAGGQYVYLHKAFGPLTGFVYGWTVFTVIQTGVIAAVATAFANYSSVFIPQLSPDNKVLTIGDFSISAAQVLAVFLVIFLTWVNSMGVRNGKLIQTFFTSAKLIALFALIILGVVVGYSTGVFGEHMAHAWETHPVDAKGVSLPPLAGLALLTALGATMINPLFSSDAWNNVTFIAGEIKNPKRNIPLSLAAGTIIVSVIYVLANLAYLMLLPMDKIQMAPGDRVGAEAVSVIFGDTAKYIMAALIMVSTFGCNNGIVLAGARLYYAMAGDGLFFKKAGTLNKHDVPGTALWLQCIWASVLCLSGSYGQLLGYCTFASLLFYIITIAGIFVLRRREPDAERPYKAFGYPLVPALYIIITLAICINLLIQTPDSAGWGLLIVLLGVPVYFITKSSKSK